MSYDPFADALAPFAGWNLAATYDKYYALFDLIIYWTIFIATTASEGIHAFMLVPLTKSLSDPTANIRIGKRITVYFPFWSLMTLRIVSSSLPFSEYLPDSFISTGTPTTTTW